MVDPTGPSQARRRALRALLILFLAMLLLLGTAFGFYAWATGGSDAGRPVTVEVPEGATSSDVGATLAEAEVIRSALMFRFMARLRGISADLRAGSYGLRTNMRLGEVFDALAAGPIPEEPGVQITLPEGLRLEQIATRVSDELGVRRRAFLREARSGEYALPPYLPEGTATVEGFLFPKTYEFPEEVAAPEVVDRLLEQFAAEVEDLPWGRAERLGLSHYEVVTLASLIEREARVDEERRTISGVIHNRLDLGMALQIDATVQYALPEHKERLTFEDLEYESPYNTYLHTGLPPGPIASPGLASIEAALRPADVDYLFYVLIDPETGEHAFAETYEEFLENRRRAGLD